MLLSTYLAAALSPLLCAAQTYPQDLIGTWSTKSNQTLTGPGFYDSLNDELIEPSRTGISYSFTGDGWYEEAYYRAIANPQNPACPGGIMQWQHGRWVMNADQSLSLTPIGVDGRQLLSQPCNGKYAIYTRYNQSEMFKNYQVLTDPYHHIPRLNLWEFDGSPMQPLYLVYSPPQMLPTSTLHPLTTATGTASSKMRKRGLDHGPFLRRNKNGQEIIYRIHADRLWWFGLTLTGLGGLLYFGPRRLGLRI